MTARFLTPLRMETIGVRSWMLVDDLVFHSERYQGVVIAPRGVQTDLASIPRVLWSLVPKVGAHDKAAVIHDGGYAHYLVTEGGERIHTVKHVADALFYEGMRAEGVSGFIAGVLYHAVRLFGDPLAHPLAANRLPEGDH